MAQVALRRIDDRSKALSDYVSQFLRMDEPRRRLAAEMSGLDIHYDLGEGHSLLGRRMPDLDLLTVNDSQRVFALLHDARPVLLNLGEPGGFDITPWADRVQLIDAKYVGVWGLPVIGAVTSPTAVLIRPDGYVAWVGEQTQLGLVDALCAGSDRLLRDNAALIRSPSRFPPSWAEQSRKAFLWYAVGIEHNVGGRIKTAKLGSIKTSHFFGLNCWWVFLQTVIDDLVGLERRRSFN